MLDFLFPDLTIRSNEKELMDLSDCDEKKLINTVNQFRLLNLFFTSSRYLISKYIISDINVKQCKNISFMDLGAGGCDIAIWFLRKCKNMGIEASITCLDSDRRIVDYSRNKCKELKEINVVEGNAFEIAGYGKFDYIFANHFLHHIEDKHIPEILKKIHAQCNNLYLLNDINRSNISYLGYSIFTKLFFHDSFAFYDGRLSIKKGFLADELQKSVDVTGVNNKMKILKHFPSRIYIIGIS